MYLFYVNKDICTDFFLCCNKLVWPAHYQKILILYFCTIIVAIMGMIINGSVVFFMFGQTTGFCVEFIYKHKKVFYCE